jgi:hypothetical protein
MNATFASSVMKLGEHNIQNWVLGTKLSRLLRQYDCTTKWKGLAVHKGQHLKSDGIALKCDVLVIEVVEVSTSALPEGG